MAKNDKRGRRHTSTVTVCTIDESMVVYELLESELEETFTRGSGPGGQHRNKTDTKVVLKHLPTGITVAIDGRSQWANRQEARRGLKKRLQTQSQTENERREQPHRAAKSFTYNTQRDEVVCHRDDRKWRLSQFMKGRI